MSARRCATAVAIALLLFSTQTPAPDQQAPEASRMTEDRVRSSSATPVSPPLTLIEAQTNAIDLLNDKLIAIERRVAALEKEKNRG